MLDHIAQAKFFATEDSEKIGIRVDLLNELTAQKKFSFESYFIRGKRQQASWHIKKRLFSQTTERTQASETFLVLSIPLKMKMA